MRNKRTKMDFSEHELIIEKSENLIVHHLKKPHTCIDSIKYINTNGILAVTGDYGNWIFTREYIPSSNGYVSDDYWEGKLRYASTQVPTEFDPDETENEIKKMLDNDDLSEEEKEYLNGCLKNLEDGEMYYKYFAYTENCGRFEDSEYVPYYEKTVYWLQVVFDGFDEMCSRLKNNENV